MPDIQFVRADHLLEGDDIVSLSARVNTELRARKVTAREHWRAATVVDVQEHGNTVQLELTTPSHRTRWFESVYNDQKIAVITEGDDES